QGITAVFRTSRRDKGMCIGLPGPLKRALFEKRQVAESLSRRARTRASLIIGDRWRWLQIIRLPELFQPMGKRMDESNRAWPVDSVHALSTCGNYRAVDPIGPCVATDCTSEPR